MLPSLDFAPLKAALDVLIELSALAPSSEELQPLLLSPQNTRAARQDHSRSSLLGLASALAEIDEVEQALASLRAKLAAWKGAIAFAVSPVSVLPVEILRRILGFAVNSDGSLEWQWRLWRKSLTFSHVCSHWRSVSTAYTSLWAFLPVTSLSNSNLIPLFATRSGHERLSLRFGVPNPPAFPPAFRVALDVPTASRLHSLTFDAPHANRSLALPDFENDPLKISSMVFDHEGEVHFDELIDHALSLTLKRCSFEEPKAHLSEWPLLQLESLSFQFTSLSTLDNFVTFDLEYLETLRLYEVRPRTRGLPGWTLDWHEEGLEFGNIKKLYIESCSASVWDWFSEARVQPNTLTLSFNEMDDDDWPWVSERMGQLFDALGRNLTTVRLMLSVHQVLAVARMLVTNVPGQWFCPSLSSLSIGWDYIADMNWADEIEEYLIPIRAQLPALLAPRLAKDVVDVPNQGYVTQLAIGGEFVYGESQDANVQKQWYEARVAEFSELDDFKLGWFDGR